jgi:hypothetical protein
MQLEFVPVEDFYFELTLAVKTLEEVATPGLAIQVGEKLAKQYGQSSTVAAASQNSYNYVFRVLNVDNAPFSRLTVSIADWQGSLRLGSDYGWTLNEEHKVVRADKFAQRDGFNQQLKAHLQEWLGMPIV